MVAILFFISFSIHIILMIITWKLMQQVKTLKNNQPEDIMDIFETYLEEFKEENRKLQKQPKTNIQNDQVDSGEREENESCDKASEVSISGIEDTGVPEPAQPEAKKEKQSYESDVTLSFEANVLHLYSQGLGIEDIAKKLNRGKTEVMLIVKFHNKNGQ